MCNYLCQEGKALVSAAMSGRCSATSMVAIVNTMGSVGDSYWYNVGH